MAKETFLDGYNKFLEQNRSHMTKSDRELSEDLYEEYIYYFESKEDFVPVSSAGAYISTNGAVNFLIKKLKTYVYLNNVLVKVTLDSEKIFSIQGLVEICDQDFILSDDPKKQKDVLKQCKITSETIIKGDVLHSEVNQKNVEMFTPISYHSLDIPNSSFTTRNFLHEKLFFKHSDIVNISETHGISIHSTFEAKYRALLAMTLKKKLIVERFEKSSENVTDFIEKLEIKIKREVLQHLNRLENQLAISKIDSPPTKDSYTHSSELLEIMDNVIWEFWEMHDESDPPNNATIEAYMLEKWPDRLKEGGKDKLNTVGRYIQTIIRPDRYRKNT
jgi:hypothetical protein